MKYVVGAMLTSFGIFWGVQGAGALWPHGDGALLVIIPYVFLISWIFVLILKRKSPRVKVAKEGDEIDEELILTEKGIIKVIKDFGYFWYDFIVGDDLVAFITIVLALFAINFVGLNGWWILPVITLGVLTNKLLIQKL